jgi:hypothetical protein
MIKKITHIWWKQEIWQRSNRPGFSHILNQALFSLGNIYCPLLL